MEEAYDLVYSWRCRAPPFLENTLTGTPGAQVTDSPGRGRGAAATGVGYVESRPPRRKRLGEWAEDAAEEQREGRRTSTPRQTTRQRAVAGPQRGSTCERRGELHHRHRPATFESWTVSGEQLRTTHTVLGMTRARHNEESSRYGIERDRAPSDTVYAPFPYNLSYNGRETAIVVVERLQTLSPRHESE